jgi:hypothetical protein
MKPVAPPARFLIRDIGDEAVVYDRERHHAHCLNRMTAAVFRLVDGRRSVGEMAALLGDGRVTPADEETVRLALEKLAVAGLIEDGCAPVEALPTSAAPRRRELLRTMSLGTALLAPVLVSLVVPAPAEAAASCLRQDRCTRAAFGQPCYVLSQAECSSKVCINNNLCR